MADSTIPELQFEQESLQAKHDSAQGSFHGARTKYAKAKQALVDFNDKYGRMLKAAEQQAALPSAEEQVPAAEDPAPVVEEPAEGFPDAVDTSNEE